MSQINLIIGVKNNDGCMTLVHAFEEGLQQYMPEGYEINTVAHTFVKEELDEAVASGQYQVVIALEKMEDKPLGQGAIKQWRKSCPDVRMILIMGGEKRGTGKAQGLYDIDYYEGLFAGDVKLQSFPQLILNGRTKEEAYEYYDLKNYVDPKKEKKQKREGESAKEESKTEEIVEEKVNEVIADNELASVYGDNVPKTDENIEVKENTTKDAEEENRADNEVIETDKSAADSTPSKTTDTKESPTEEVVEKSSESEETEENESTAEESGPAGSKKEESSEDIKEKPVTADEVEEKDKKESAKELEEEDISPIKAVIIKEDTPDLVVKESYEEEPRGDNSRNSGTKEKVFSDTSEDSSKGRQKNVKTSFFKQNEVKTYASSTILKSEKNAKSYFDMATEASYKVNAKEEQNTYGRTEELFVKTLDVYLRQYEVMLNDCAMGTLLRESLEDRVIDTIESFPETEKVKEAAFERFMNFACGYDFLEDLINNESVTDIHVLGASHIRVKQNGERYSTNLKFFGRGRYQKLCELLLLRHRNHLNSTGLYTSFTDNLFSDDYLLQVTIIDKSVNANNEPELLIKKTLKTKKVLKDIVEDGHMSVTEAAYLVHEVIDNTGAILICGSTESGKTTLLNALIDYIPKSKSGNIIQHRDELMPGTHPEITVQHPLAPIEGRDGVSVERLAENALEKDIDYYILGDLKGKETESFYRAISTGFIGMSCITALDADEALDKFVNYIAGADYDLRQQLRENVSEKISAIVVMENTVVKSVYKLDGMTRDNKYNLEVIDTE